MMRPVVELACRGETYITSDLSPTDKTAVVCDGQQLPFSDNILDLIASFEVIEHIPDTNRFLSEITRTLMPGGYLLLSMPFLYGRHDFQDFYRWTAQGLERCLGLHGLKICVLKNRGGTFLTITTLLLNYIHSIFSPSSDSWRARGVGKKMYFGIMTVLLSPLVLLSWLCFWLDLLIDRNSSNPSGFVCIAQKKGSSIL